MNDTPRIVSFSEALDVVLREAAKVSAPAEERIPLLEAAGRILAQEVRADRDQPPFARSTRDGFAVRAEEWSRGAKLRLAGQVRAGQAWSGEVASGEAIEIMTGAPVPAGANAVAMVEHAEQDGDAVWAAQGRTLRVGENIVPQGSEAKAGDVLLESGLMVDAAAIALAASCGYAALDVFRCPSVAILATGDELVEVSETPEPHQIRNSNSYAIAALVAAAGGEAQRLPVARDTKDELRASLDEARSAKLMLLSGGVSAGKYDLVEEVLAELGAEFFFTGVKMQPGKPLVFGRIPRGDGTWTYFFGLPGNPVSAQVTFHCFAAPLLRALCCVNAADRMPRFVQATLEEDVPAKAGLTRVLPARLESNLDAPRVRLVAWQGSGDLAANARANCYAVLPDGEELRSGDVVTVLLR